jgi:dTDP-4-amino-4,6-dideoxygalactose transaminase
VNIQRTLPPTAPPLTWRDLGRGLIGLCLPHRAEEKLQAEFRRYFGARYVFFLTSGKAALALILLGLSRLSPRKKVVMPGYTCYSVPSAVVKVGLEVSLCDIDADTLDFNWTDLQRSLSSEVLCVIPTHLLGYPADVERLRSLCHGKGIYIVEDVAQAFGAKHNGQPLGTLGDVALFSFGRGKDLTCGSGGVVLTNSDVLGEALRQEYQRLPQESFGGSLQNWCRLFLMKIFINPWMYWIPAGLPFLKLGETQFYYDFPMTRMDPVRAALLCGWPDRLPGAAKVRRQNAEWFERRIPDRVGTIITAKPQDSPSFLKLPVFLNTSEMKARLCAKSQEQGLGISPLYPTSIELIPELRQHLSDGSAPISKQVADRLVTLPTHHMVSAHDMHRVLEALEELAAQETDSGTVGTSGDPRPMTTA